MTEINGLGLPITGTITKSGRRDVEQYPVEQLRPIVQAVVDDPFIAEVGWHQYTPYFNDGEPCEFQVHTPWVRTIQDPSSDKYWELEMYNHPTFTNSPAVEESAQRAMALSMALEGGHFEKVLEELFGDHARVTLTKSGFHVDFHNHD
jgi:hypothetical protein